MKKEGTNECNSKLVTVQMVRDLL